MDQVSNMADQIDVASHLTVLGNVVNTYPYEIIAFVVGFCISVYITRGIIVEKMLKGKIADMKSDIEQLRYEIKEIKGNQVYLNYQYNQNLQHNQHRNQSSNQNRTRENEPAHQPIYPSVPSFEE